MQLCCLVKLVRLQIQPVGENEVLPHCVFSHCLHIVPEINPRLVYAFKLFKLPFPAKISFLCIINAVTRRCRYGSLTCYQTIQFPAAPPTYWACASSYRTVPYWNSAIFGIAPGIAGDVIAPQPKQRLTLSLTHLSASADHGWASLQQYCWRQELVIKGKILCIWPGCFRFEYA